MGRRIGNHTHITNAKKIKIGILLVMIVALTGGVGAPFVQADAYQEKIDALKRENSAAQSARSELQASAATLEEQIAQNQKEIRAIEVQIAANRAEDRALQRKIVEQEQQLEAERAVLGESVKQMYVESNMTTLEMLASSKDFSEFVDREQYRTNVQTKITEAMARIQALQDELSAKKLQVEKLLQDQETMRANLAARRSETTRLLTLNKTEQAAYNRDIQANNSRITELQRQQAIENARYNVGAVSYSGSGDYPWANVPFPNSISDPWGMYKRQCVSYTAWKVASTGRHMPYWGGRGNAKLWDDNARAAGIPVDYNPRVGDVAISNAGTYGHAMYVEKVHGDGTITVSQYNASWDGKYSVVRRSAAGLSFIHF